MPLMPIVRMIILALLVLPWFPSLQVAQEVPEIKPSQQSVLLFELCIEAWLEEAKLAKLDMSATEVPFGSGPFEGFKVSEVKRVYGSASFPKNLKAITAMMQGGAETELPFEVFVQIQFKDAQICEKFEASVREVSRVEQINGKEFLKSKGIGPDNFVCRRFDETTFEFGTALYCQQDKRALLSDRLEEIYRSVPDQSLRIAIDLETPKKFIQEVIEMGKQRENGSLRAAYLDFATKAKSLTVTHSLAAKNLLTLAIEAKDEADAEQISAGLDSLLGTIELIAGKIEIGIPPSSESVRVYQELLGSLEADQDGKLTKIEIPRPKGFFEAFNEYQSIANAKTQQTKRRNRFRQLGLACLNFESAFQAFPFNYDRKIDKGLSWRVKVLPFLDELKVYEALNLEAGPEDEANAAFLKKMPRAFGGDGELCSTCWIKTDAKGYADIADDPSQTVMLIETPRGRPWLSANPLTVDQAVEMVAGLPDGVELVVVMYDGSVRTISNTVEKKKLRLLFEPADGEEIPKL